MWEVNNLIIQLYEKRKKQESLGKLGKTRLVFRCLVMLSNIKTYCNKDLLYSTQNFVQCYVAGWMGGEFRGVLCD